MHGTCHIMSQKNKGDSNDWIIIWLPYWKDIESLI